MKPSHAEDDSDHPQLGTGQLHLRAVDPITAELLWSPISRHPCLVPAGFGNWTAPADELVNRMLISKSKASYSAGDSSGQAAKAASKPLESN